MTQTFPVLFFLWFWMVVSFLWGINAVPSEKSDVCSSSRKFHLTQQDVAGKHVWKQSEWKLLGPAEEKTFTSHFAPHMYVVTTSGHHLVAAWVVIVFSRMKVAEGSLLSRAGVSRTLAVILREILIIYTLTFKSYDCFSVSWIKSFGLQGCISRGENQKGVSVISPTLQESLNKILP